MNKPADEVDAEPPTATEPQDNDSGVEPAAEAISGLGKPVGISRPIMLRLDALRRPFTSLAYRNFRLVWCGALVSNIGSWMQNIARDWLVYDLSGADGSLWLGLNGFVEGVAVTAALPLGGVLADHLDRRRLLIVTNLTQALLAAILAVLAATGRIQAWHILAMTALNGMGESVRIPANQSLMPSLVDRLHLSNAVALGSLQFNLSRVVGPVLGGWALFHLGAQWSFGLNAASFMAVIAALLFVRDLPPNPRRHEPFYASLASGVSYLRSRADLILMLTMVLLTGMLGAPILKLLPPLASEALGGDARTFSSLLSWFGAGAMIGAMGMASRSERGPTPWRAMPVLVLLGAAEIAAGYVRELWVTCGLCMLMGMLFININVRLNTAVMYSSPDAVRGRMSSFQMLAFRGGMPLGTLIAGSLAQLINIRATFIGFGATMIAAALVVITLSRRVQWRLEG